MNRPGFTSVFAEDFDSYIDYRENCGVKAEADYTDLRKLDRFLASKDLDAKRFPPELADEWMLPLPNESPLGHYKRINNSKRFLSYLFVKGYEVFVIRDIRSPRTDFIPHIYSKEETERYFRCVDTYASSINKYHAVQLPILFRLLCCCGTRIGETLFIRKKDVDLEEGIIKLCETKNTKERYVVMSESLRILFLEFSDKVFYLLNDDDYIFRNCHGQRLRQESVEDIHTKILRHAGIPKNDDGPRIHDWRHTFAVRSFKQLSDMGYDMYVSLPVLSSYLGHGTIMATEKYLRLTLDLYPELMEKYQNHIDKVFKEKKDERQAD